MRRRALAALATLGSGGLLLVAGWLGGVDRAAPATPPAAAAVPSPVADVAQALNPAAAKAAASPTAASRLARAGSLEGSALDGDWSLDPVQGLPRPNKRLRERLDHLLSQQGERRVDEMRLQWIALLDADGLPPAARAALRERFDAYLAVLQHPYQVHADPRAPHTWRAALAERQRVRRARLGWDWADAFFGDEERALLAALEGAPPDASPEPTRHPDAAAREAQVEATWRHWTERLAATQALWQRLQSAPELSAPQREAALQAHLQQHFDAGEQRRVRALLGV